MVMRGVVAAEFDALEDFCLSFITEAGQFGELVLIAGLLAGFDRVDAELTINRLDLLWS